MKTIYILQFAAVFIFYELCLGDMPGMELLFGKSVLDEVYNVPITFDKPIPKWIKGSLIRNGPARYEMGNRSFLNLFDGFGKLYSWSFPGNGSASFSTQFIKSQSYNESIAMNDIAPYQTFDTTLPPQDFLNRELSTARGIDNMNINVYNYSGDCVTLTDAWKLYVIDCTTLDVIRPSVAEIPNVITDFPFISKMSVAHPVSEYDTENYLTILSSISVIPGVQHKYTLVRVKSADMREKIAEWNVERMAYMHAFSATKNYAIILACPYYISVVEMLKYSFPKDSMFFNKTEPTYAYIVELKTGKVTKIKTENIFTMHHVNAYEENDRSLVLDIVSYDDTTLVSFFEVNILLNKTKRDSVNFKPQLKRFHIDLSTKTMRSTTPFVSSENVPFAYMLEVPTINEKFRSVHYCYVYGVVFKSDFKEFGKFSFVKKDLCNSTGDRSWSLPGHYPVEGWFVADPSGVLEDDGIVMVPVLDGIKGKSYLLTLDARTLLPIGKAYLPVVVPFHFHGRFM